MFYDFDSVTQRTDWLEQLDSSLIKESIYLNLHLASFKSLYKFGIIECFHKSWNTWNCIKYHNYDDEEDDDEALVPCWYSCSWKG